MTPHERLFFAQAVLRHEPDTHKVLSDLLEEEGERALADWARARKGNKYKRLDFVMALLPYMVSLQLGTEYLSHALKQVNRQTRTSWGFRTATSWTAPGALSPLIEAVETICQWAQGAIDADSMNEACMVCSRVGPWSYGIQDIDQVMQALHAAARCAEIAEACRERMDGTGMRTHGTQAGVGARRVTKASRNIHSDIAWQLDRADKLVQKLLESES